ncbi:hypothetical protein J2T08_003304 [Neorhizobium galegae]|uniref:hypothetical protein n=1 Tax=Neorhizobium galegae TaxID=399 RepID=UPI00278A5D35|nr:hypothetical protein [Neorhizobium galegae]MDQ0135383.1 hypothetical protein [Neorhizobium galegae]
MLRSLRHRVDKATERPGLQVERIQIIPRRRHSPKLQICVTVTAAMDDPVVVECQRPRKFRLEIEADLMGFPTAELKEIFDHEAERSS